MNSEQMDHGSKEQYSGFELADISFSEPVYVDAEVQTDLTACDIDIMADCKEKLENKTQLKRDLLRKRPRRKLIRLVNAVFRWDFTPIFIHYYKLQFFSCAALKKWSFLVPGPVFSIENNLNALLFISASQN